MVSQKVSVRVPVDRVGVIVGREGAVKKKIESLFNAKLVIDGSTGEIEVQFDPSVTDPVKIEKLRALLNAVGIGFSPPKALRLSEDDAFLEIIDLHELVGKSPQELERVKGRIIGKRGRAWKNIEEMTGTSLSVHGRYVGIIGGLEGSEVAKNAIMMLVEGKQHKTIYKYLERMRRELKRRSLEIWETEVKTAETQGAREGP
ncbi:MAG: RNA-processing protein [Candidatus Brockarchaeota archaeon]|nr:RNA-processing protein [Candidatus Brockarchaeota archaeon]